MKIHELFTRMPREDRALLRDLAVESAELETKIGIMLPGPDRTMAIRRRRQILREINDIINRANKAVEVKSAY